MIRATCICPWYWEEKRVGCIRSGCYGEIKKTKSEVEVMFSSEASCICAWNFRNDMNRWAAILMFKISSKQEYFRTCEQCPLENLFCLCVGIQLFGQGEGEKARREKILHWYMGVVPLKSMEFGYITWTIDPLAVIGRFGCDICRTIISFIYWWVRLRQTAW